MEAAEEDHIDAEETAMTNGKPTAQEHLSKAVADSTKAPEPSLWVRIVQMVFAGLTLGGAVAVALLLILHGPPAPKEPEGPEGESGSKTAKTTSAAASGSVATYLVASSDEPAPAADGEGGAPASGGSGGEPAAGSDQGSGEGDEGGGESEGSEESESSTADSLANLNEQAPWALAIVALLVGAFIATGKSLNFNGTQQS